METLTRSEALASEKKRMRLQVDAEAVFGEYLEAQGVSPNDFMKQWKLSAHQFNTLAHYIHGVNDEEPALPPALNALLRVMENRRAA